MPSTLAHVACCDAEYFGTQSAARIAHADSTNTRYLRHVPHHPRPQSWLHLTLQWTGHLMKSFWVDATDSVWFNETGHSLFQYWDEEMGIIKTDRQCVSQELTRLLPELNSTYRFNYLHLAESFRRSWMSLSHSRNSQHFTELERSLLRSQQLATCPNPRNINAAPLWHRQVQLPTAQMRVIILLCIGRQQMRTPAATFVHQCGSNPLSAATTSLQMSPPKTCIHFFSFPTCHMPGPSYPNWLYDPHNSWPAVQSMKLLVTQLSPVSWYFLSSQDTSIFPAPYSRTPSASTVPSVWQTKFHTHIIQEAF